MRSVALIAATACRYPGWDCKCLEFDRATGRVIELDDHQCGGDDADLVADQLEERLQSLSEDTSDTATPPAEYACICVEGESCPGR